MSVDNHCTFIGRVGAAPEPIGTTGGLKFRLGTDHFNGQTKQKETIWVPFTAWGRQADVIRQFGTVGRQLLISAEYRPREYEAQTPQGPQKRTDHQFVVQEVKLLAEGRQAQGQFSGPPTSGFAAGPEPAPNDPWG